MFEKTRLSLAMQLAHLVTPALMAAALFGTALLTGCNPKPQLSLQNLDITGNRQFADPFELPDTNGQIRTLVDYRGKIVGLVFVYTHCPDVCTTTLAACRGLT